MRQDAFGQIVRQARFPRRMYSTCTFCYAPLGDNDVLESFPVARRVAFDPHKGCLWAVCPHCARWNLAPIEERWETVEDCERRFRATSLRYSSGNIGLAWLRGDCELVRIGPALRPEVAAWRYGRQLTRRRPLRRLLVDGTAGAIVRAWRSVGHPHGRSPRDPRAAAAQLLLHVYGNRILDFLPVALPPSSDGMDRPIGVVRFRHLVDAALVRPELGAPWSLRLPHDGGVLAIEGNAGVRAAAHVLAIVNGTERGSGGGFSHAMLEGAVRKVEASAVEDSYFNRVLTLALRSSWGRHGGSEQHPESSWGHDIAEVEGAGTTVERLAYRLTGRTFWAHGGIGSEPATLLLDVPLVDRLALEMAAHEESERRALEGELDELCSAWREADEIATIADALLDD